MANRKRVAGKGDHALTPGPLLVIDARITDHGISQMGLTLLRNAADGELPHWDTAMRTVEVHVQASAGLELQHIFPSMQCPDTHQRCVE